MTLGERIRARREMAGISLRRLASQTNLPHSFISQIERDQADPSLTSLRKIADALDTPLADFFAEDETCINCIVRRNQRRKLQLPGSGITYEILNPESIDQLQVFLATMEPGFVEREEFSSHPTQECTLVLQGRLRLEIGDEEFILEQGDSAGWDGRLPHRFNSIGNEPLVVVSATSPPMFEIRSAG